MNLTDFKFCIIYIYIYIWLQKQENKKGCENVLGEIKN